MSEEVKKTRRPSLRFNESEIKLALSVMENMEKPIELMYYLMERENEKPFVIILISAKDIELARERVGWIVSRDTSELNEEEISKAAVESLLENGSDAIFATLFWFAIGGATGVLLYRLSNTLDAMWGYRNNRYLYFGRFSARIDDILNWIPARLTALSYCIFGDFKTAWHCWHTQGAKWYSPNAGPVMAAGAGALGLKLGGDAVYHGKLKPRLELGGGRSPKPKDISRAWNMIKNVMIFWCFIAIFVYLVCK